MKKDIPKILSLNNYFLFRAMLAMAVLWTEGALAFKINTSLPLKGLQKRGVQ